MFFRRIFFSCIFHFIHNDKRFYLCMCIYDYRAPLKGIGGDPNRKSYHRLLLFSDIAKQTLKTNKLRYQVVTAFASTLALYDKLCDCDHYTQSVKMPQLLQIIDKIKLSNIAMALARGVGI